MFKIFYSEGTEHEIGMTIVLDQEMAVTVKRIWVAMRPCFLF